MSFVAEIIASIKSKPADEQHSKTVPLEVLLKQSEEAVVCVSEALSQRYDSFSDVFNKSLKLQKKVDLCLNAINNIDKEIKEEVLGNVERSVGELDRILGRWKEVSKELEVAKTLLEINTCLEEAQTAEISHQYFTVAQNLTKIEKRLAEIDKKEIESQLDIIYKVKDELVLRRSNLILQMDEVWQSTVKWEEDNWHQDSGLTHLVVRNLDNLVSDANAGVMKQMFLALFMLGELRRKVKAFGKALMDYLLRPIICEFALVKVLPREDSFSIQAVQITGHSEKAAKLTDANVKTSLSIEILNTVREVFEFLHRVFCIMRTSVDEEDVSFLSLLGHEIGEGFVKLVSNDCLAEAIPCRREDLSAFDQVQNTAKQLNAYLVSIKFFSDEQTQLLGYDANIEAIFSSKACSYHLSKARDLMVSPLHTTVTVTPLSSGQPLLLGGDEKTDKLSSKFERMLSSQTFNIPKCQVSISVCHLMDLIYDILEEACASSPDYSRRLFYTVRNILSLYCQIVPTAHAHSLDTIPQYAALVHNNSMFLAHHAFLIGHQYSSRLPFSSKEKPLTMADLGHIIRMTGCEVFLKSIQGHKEALLSNIREGFALPSLGCELSSVNSAEVSVRQCLNQLGRLHSVWQDVLPKSVYLKSIGSLASSVVEEVVSRIVRLQDISADSGLGLINILNHIKSDLPLLFKVVGESDCVDEHVLREVPVWSKMNELIVVLGANLRELAERWSVGKGPLAQHFTPDETKQLIRALFQNTERRAAVLAMIK